MKKPEGDFFEYVDELQADPARDILVHKRQWGAFYGTDLDLQLRRRGVTGIVPAGISTSIVPAGISTSIVPAGISTSIGVESTARDAWERAYNLTFAADALTDTNAEAHARALEIIFPRLGEIGTVQEILAKLG